MAVFITPVLIFTRTRSFRGTNTALAHSRGAGGQQGVVSAPPSPWTERNGEAPAGLTPTAASRRPGDACAPDEEEVRPCFSLLQSSSFT